MAKTNFSKAEEALTDALQKLSMQQLLVLADAHAGTLEQVSKRSRARALLLAALRHEIKRLQKNNPDIFKVLKLKKSTLEKWSADPTKLTDEDWTKIIKLKVKVDEEVKKISVDAPSDVQLVASERRRHINKRFNVNDKWLPLR